MGLNFTLGKIISIIILLWVISGYYPRVTGVLHWWVSYSFVLSSFIIDGGDQIASILTLFLIPITFLDKRKNHWISESNSNIYNSTICYFSTILIRLQVAVIYFHAAVGKFSVAEWVNGTALYYWLSSQSFGAPEWLLYFITPLLRNPITITFLTWMIMFLELLLAAGCFIKNKTFRKSILITGITFHFGIWIVHGLFSFFMIMTAALILSYLYPNYSGRKIKFKFKK